MQNDDEDAKQEDIIEHLRFENLLVYTPPASGCLIDSRQHKSLNFGSQSYGLGDTMQCILNSGADAIYGPGCFLRLEFTATFATGGVPPNFGYGTVMNLLRNLRLIHRSGNSLEEVLNINVVAQLKRLWNTSLEDRKKLDGMLLAYQPMLADGTGATALGAPVLSDTYSPDGGTKNFLPVLVDDAAPRVPSAVGSPAGAHKFVATIPLGLISGVFANKSQMIPPALLAGAKLEIDIDNGALAVANWTAYTTGANGFGGVGGGTITNFRPTIVYDANVLYNSVNKQLLMEQAREPDSGLAFVFSTWFTTSNIYAADASLDVSQSASICERAIAVVRDSAALAPAADSFNFLAPFLTYQFRIGSHYLPLQPVKLPAPTYENAQLATNDGREAYDQALMAWGAGVDQYHGSADCGSSLSFMPDTWLPTLDTIAANARPAAPASIAFAAGGACYAASLEKSPCGLAFSGQSTNNSRILNIQLTGPPVPTPPVLPATFQVMGCLEYIRSARVSGDNCIVDR